MDRIFLDANILLIASYREGAALARLWEISDARLLTSAYVLQETWRNADSAEQRLRLAVLVPAMELVEELPPHEATARKAGLPEKDACRYCMRLSRAALRTCSPPIGGTSARCVDRPSAEL
jgi:hypothetical protein